MMKRVTKEEHDFFLLNPGQHPCNCGHLAYLHVEKVARPSKKDEKPTSTWPCTICGCVNRTPMNLEIVEHAYETAERVYIKDGDREGYVLVNQRNLADPATVDPDAHPDGQQGDRTVTDVTLQRETKIETHGGGSSGRRRDPKKVLEAASSRAQRHDQQLSEDLEPPDRRESMNVWLSKKAKKILKADPGRARAALEREADAMVAETKAS